MHRHDLGGAAPNGIKYELPDLLWESILVLEAHYLEPYFPVCIEDEMWFYNLTSCIHSLEMLFSQIGQIGHAFVYLLGR